MTTLKPCKFIEDMSNEILIAAIASTQQYLNELRDERDERESVAEEEEPDDLDDDGNPDDNEPPTMPE